MTKSIAFKGDLTLALSVKNLDAAIDWYGRALGCELLYKLEDLAWCELTSPLKGVSIGLGVNQEAPKGGCTPVWGVEDIAAARRALEAMDVRFDGETREVPGQVLLATFYDPDGNSWMLVESIGAMG